MASETRKSFRTKKPSAKVREGLIGTEDVFNILNYVPDASRHPEPNLIDASRRVMMRKRLRLLPFLGIW